MSENKYNSIWHVLRSASDGGFVTRGRAGTGGEGGVPIRYHVSFPFILSAINLTSNAANLSRIIPIIMKHDDKHVDPGIALANKWTDAQFEELSKGITVATLSHVPNIMKIYHNLHSKYNSGVGSGQMYSSRFIEVILPMLSFMKHIGLDEEEFLKEFSESKSRFMEQLEHSDTDDILTALLHTTYRFGNINDGDPTQLYEILRHKVERDVLNGISCGVRFFSEIKYLRTTNRNWLLVHWPTVVNGLMRNNAKYRDVSPTSLKEQASRAATVIPDEIYRKANAFRKANKLVGPQYDSKNVTVYDVSYIVDDVVDIEEEPEEEML
jgi:hypothetical protein